MTEIALADAKNRLSELITRVQNGEDFAITRRGKVVARLASPDSTGARTQAHDAVARLRESRHGIDLQGLKSRDLVKRGRR